MPRLSKPLFAILPPPSLWLMTSICSFCSLMCNLVSPASLNVPSCYTSFWDCIFLKPFLSLEIVQIHPTLLLRVRVQLWKNTVKMETTDTWKKIKYRELNSFDRHRSQVLCPFGLLTRIIHEYVTQSLLNYDKGCVCLRFYHRG